MPETLTKIDSDPVSVDTVDGQELMVTIMNLYLTMSVSRYHLRVRKNPEVYYQLFTTARIDPILRPTRSRVRTSG